MSTSLPLYNVVEMPARYPGRCRECREPIAEGETVVFDRTLTWGSKVYHPECHRQEPRVIHDFTDQSGRFIELHCSPAACATALRRAHELGCSTGGALVALKRDRSVDLTSADGTVFVRIMTTR